VNREALRDLLEQVRAGNASVDDALLRLRNMPYEDLGYARIDHHRAVRRGQPEVIYCPGKLPEQIGKIAAALRAVNPVVLATRADEAAFCAVSVACPDARYDSLSGLITIGEVSPSPHRGRVAVVSAGTADLRVAEEAAGTLDVYGHEVERIYDVGVAGLHRLLGSLDRLLSAQVIIVVAGMDGALPSVVGGLVQQPVIAVPTSVGYGASFGGLAALLSMLNSCASGVSVVNIDNGFGAARVADSILRAVRQQSPDE
jgi:pyridinium-3,5-biscarboxylic acid mononucleotide synthase